MLFSITTEVESTIQWSWLIVRVAITNHDWLAIQHQQVSFTIKMKSNKTGHFYGHLRKKGAKSGLQNQPILPKLLFYMIIIRGWDRNRTDVNGVAAHMKLST